MSAFAPRELRTKDGAALALRELVPEDAQTVLDTVRPILAESAFTVRLPEEMPSEAAEEARWIESARAGGALLLGACVEGSFAGLLTLEPLGPARARHVASLGMSLALPQRGRGVGRALLEAALDWARESAHVEKVELCCLADNAVGLALYESVGFEHEGRRRGKIQRSPGEYVDDVLMGIWTPSSNPGQTPAAP